MLVRDVMARGAATIGPGETLQAAARTMRATGASMLVVSEGGRLLGLITDRDLVTRAVAEGRDPAWSPVHGTMTPQVVACGEDDDLVTAARRMEEHAVRWLVVLDGEGEPAGVLGVDDLAAVDRSLAARVRERTGAPERIAPEVWVPAWEGEETWP